MRREDFIVQMDELKRHARPVVYGGGALTILVELGVVASVFSRHPPRSHGQPAAVWYLAGLAATVLAVAVFLLVLRRTVTQHAPACPSCGARATWRERSRILASGLCPRCGGRFVG